MTNVIDQIQEQVRNSTNILGDVFAWSIQVGTPGILRADVVAALEAADLPDVDIPDTTPPHIAANRAVKRVTKLHGLDYDVITDTHGAKVWAVVDSNVSDDSVVGDAIGTLTNKIFFDKIDHQLVAKEDTPLAREIAALYHEWTDYVNAEDIRKIVHTYLAVFGAMRLVGSGGQYFVRASNAEDVRKLRGVINGLGGSEALCLPIPDVEDATQGVGMVARRHVSDEIARLKAEHTKWAEKTPRDSTMERRLKEYRTLRVEMEDMADILQFQSDDLTTQIDALTTNCEAMMGASSVPDETTNETSPDNGASAPVAPTKPVVPEDDSPKLSEFSVAQLKKAAKAKGIAVKGLRKEALIAALSA